MYTVAVSFVLSVYMCCWTMFKSPLFKASDTTIPAKLARKIAMQNDNCRKTFPKPQWGSKQRLTQ